MFVLITTRVVKKNTGATEKFAPRSVNATDTYVSGPFLSLKAAQRACLTALGTHTCLDASIWSEAQVADRMKHGGSALRMDEERAMRAAQRCFGVAG